MDTLLSKMNAKLRGVPYQPKTGNNKHVGNNAGNSPLSNVQVNAEPNKPARGNGLGNNPLEAIQVNANKEKQDGGRRRRHRSRKGSRKGSRKHRKHTRRH